MKLLSLLAVLLGAICCFVPILVDVHEEVDYYILATLCVITGLLARITAHLERSDIRNDKTDI